MFEDTPSDIVTPAHSDKPARRKSRVLPLLIVLLLAVATGAAVFFYDSYQKAKIELAELKANPSAAATDENKKTVLEVGKLIVVPSDETPTIATVVDKQKLQDQKFFGKVQNGDKVLIYANAKKVYLYRPTNNKIIEVGTLNVEQAGQTR